VVVGEIHYSLRFREEVRVRVRVRIRVRVRVSQKAR
jgi:hypothetical protein